MPEPIGHRQVPQHTMDRIPFITHNRTLKGEWGFWSAGRLPSAWREVLYIHDHDSGGRMYVVSSYSTPIAWWTERHGWVKPDVRYSVTTSKHQGKVRTDA